MSGTDGGDFNISQNGELTFRNTPNYESPADSNRNNEYLLTVVATDEGRLRGSLDVTVMVTDVDDTGPTDTTLLGRYDTDGDPGIDKDEIGVAYRDYLFNRTISKDDIGILYRIYLFGG